MMIESAISYQIYALVCCRCVLKPRRAEVLSCHPIATHSYVSVVVIYIVVSEPPTGITVDVVLFRALYGLSSQVQVCVLLDDFLLLHAVAKVDGLSVSLALMKKYLNSVCDAVDGMRWFAIAIKKAFGVKPQLCAKR